MKKWNVLHASGGDITGILLKNRGIRTKSEQELYLRPPNPQTLTARDVGIDETELGKAVGRITKAIKDKESIVVYADYDADGITAGAVMWEAVHMLGGNIMPYIPHRVEEGYGLSTAGIDKVRQLYNPTLIITVDHGITARDKVSYAGKLGIDTIVTDHHVKPEKLPHCPIVHTTKLAGSGVAWFVAKELLAPTPLQAQSGNLLELATIGTIADMVPLVGPNRSIARWGLIRINETTRTGLSALITDAGLAKGKLGTYEISHILAPRLNAMGRLEHALDALRLLCTKNEEKAFDLAKRLGLTNQERQRLTSDTTTHALQGLTKLLRSQALKKLLFVSHETYNQGVIGLVAGKLVEEYYRPAIVVAKGELYSKASARSVAGFNIIEAIRTCTDILVDAGGHPMAAGFTVETKHLAVLQTRLEALADKELKDELLTRVMTVDMEIPLSSVTFELWEKLREFEPFGFGNTEPVFATRGVKVMDTRLVGNDGKHLKLLVRSPSDGNSSLSAIAFGMGSLSGELKTGTLIDIAYTVDVDTWNGNRKLQLKIKDIHLK